MAYTARIEVHGIKEALAELNSFDPKYRRQVTKDISAAGQKIIVSARDMIKNFDNSESNGAPLSRMYKSKLVKGRDVYWDNNTVRAGFKVKVGAAAQRQRLVTFKDKFDPETNPRESHNVLFKAKPYQLMVIQQKDAAGAIYDHAGRRTKGIFVNNLNAEVGLEPRAIDPAVDMHRETVEKEVLAICEKVMEKLNKNLQVRHGD
jgi:hypothetical protein